MFTLVGAERKRKERRSSVFTIFYKVNVTQVRNVDQCVPNQVNSFLQDREKGRNPGKNPVLSPHVKMRSMGGKVRLPTSFLTTSHV